MVAIKQKPDGRIVTIRPPKAKPIRLETWKYHEIVDALRTHFAKQQEAYQTADWLGKRSKPGDKKTIDPGIEIEVTADV